MAAILKVKNCIFALFTVFCMGSLPSSRAKTRCGTYPVIVNNKITGGLNCFLVVLFAILIDAGPGGNSQLWVETMLVPEVHKGPKEVQYKITNVPHEDLNS